MGRGRSTGRSMRCGNSLAVGRKHRDDPEPEGPAEVRSEMMGFAPTYPPLAQHTNTTIEVSLAAALVFRSASPDSVPPGQTAALNWPAKRPVTTRLDSTSNTCANGRGIVAAHGPAVNPTSAC